MDRLTLAAPAKLNLRLLVGPAGADGYHPIRSLLVTLDGLSDTITLTRADERAVRCPGLDGPDNLAWHALDALERAVGRPVTCAVDIAKRIPAQAGLGGGLERRGGHPVRREPAAGPGPRRWRARGGGGAGWIRRAVLHPRGRAVGDGTR